MSRFVAALFVAVAVAACADAANEAAASAPTVEQAYLADPIGDGPTAMYVMVRNDTDGPVALVAVETEAAEQVELHTQRRMGDMMVMEQLDSIPIGAGDVMQMRPGADHIMLLDPHSSLFAGDTVAATLIFSSGQRIETEVPVVSYPQLVEIFEAGAMAPLKERD